MKPDLMQRMKDYLESENLELRVVTETVRVDRVNTNGVSIADVIAASDAFTGFDRKTWPTALPVPVLMKYRGGTYTPLVGAKVVAGAAATGRNWVTVRVVDERPFHALQRKFNIQLKHYAALVN